jgi:hypothetical protein
MSALLFEGGCRRDKVEGGARETFRGLLGQVGGCGTESSLTLSWRKPDSNRRYRVTRPRFRERLMSPPLDSPPTEKSARTRTETTATPGAFRGTDGSNPVPSSGESTNHRFRRDFRAPPRVRTEPLFHLPGRGMSGKGVLNGCSTVCLRMRIASGARCGRCCHQGLDGSNALPDPRAETGPYRNEPPRPRLQSEADNLHPRSCRLERPGLA